jgi:hypothetical protein
MIKFIDKPTSGVFRHLSPESVFRRCVDELLTPRGGSNPSVMVQTGYAEEDRHDTSPLTMLTIDVDDEQVEIAVDEKTWRNALRAALAEIDDAV